MSQEIIIGTPGSGKSWASVNNFDDHVLVTFVSHESLIEHLNFARNKGKKVGVYVLEDTDYEPFQIPNYYDLMLIDHSFSRNVTKETQIFLEKMMRINKVKFKTWVIDEAHLIFNQYSKITSDNPLIQFLSICRNFGIRIVSATQRPQQISSDVAGLMRGVLLGKVTDKNAKKYMREWLSSINMIYKGKSVNFDQLNNSLEKHEFVYIKLDA